MMHGCDAARGIMTPRVTKPPIMIRNEMFFCAENVESSVSVANESEPLPSFMNHLQVSCPAEDCEVHS